MILLQSLQSIPDNLKEDIVEDLEFIYQCLLQSLVNDRIVDASLTVRAQRQLDCILSRTHVTHVIEQIFLDATPSAVPSDIVTSLFLHQ